LTVSGLLRLDERIELLDRRLSEQEALLDRYRKALGMPGRSPVPTPSLRRTPSAWRRPALALGYVFTTFGRLILAGMMTVLVLALVAASLRLISK
jgi:hypothetical protein